MNKLVNKPIELTLREKDKRAAQSWISKYNNNSKNKRKIPKINSTAVSYKKEKPKHMYDSKPKSRY